MAAGKPALWIALAMSSSSSSSFFVVSCFLFLVSFLVSCFLFLVSCFLLLGLARRDNADFLAFVMDAYGGWGKQAVKIMLFLKELTDTQSRVIATQTLAVALQRGNAIVARAGAMRARAAASQGGRR